MQDTGIFAHNDLVVTDQRAFIPCAVLIHGNIAFICHHISKSKVTPINIFLFHLGSILPLSRYGASLSAAGH